MKFNKKRMTGLLSLAMVAAIGVSSLAIFTDRAQSNATAKAGSLDLQLTQSWNADNADAISHFAPGDVLNLKYTLVNDSTLAAKVREFFTIKSDKAIPIDTFRIYKLSDLTKDANTGWYSVNAGASPVATLDESTWDSGKYVKYSLPQFVLDGTHADQTGKATTTPNTDTNNDGKIYANTSEGDQYVLLFNKDALTSVAGANITVEYVAEAMQHSGTGAATEDDLWQTVCTETITLGGGSQKVAPDLEFDPGIPETPVAP